MIDWNDFMKVEIHVGKIVEAKMFTEARNPSYLLEIDFGNEIGIKKSSAQITDFYSPEELKGMQVCAVTNFPPKQIANKISECLVLGAVGENGVTLIKPERSVTNGLRVG